MQAQKEGVLQHDQLYKLVHDAIHVIEARLRDDGWLKDGKLQLGQKVKFFACVSAMWCSDHDARQEC